MFINLLAENRKPDLIHDLRSNELHGLEAEAVIQKQIVLMLIYLILNDSEVKARV